MKRKITRGLSLVLAGLLPAIAMTGDCSAAGGKLNKTKLTLSVGKSYQLKVKGTRKKVTWSSSKKRIASVTSNGKVKAKRAGKAVITAKVSSRSLHCKITVKASALSHTSPPPMQTPAATTAVSPTPPPNATASATPSSGTLAADAGEYSLSNVHSGEGTYYNKASIGAANLDYMETLYYTVAMNDADYRNGLAGAYIEITDKDGDKVNAVVTDRLPSGKKGDVDMTRNTFAAIEPLETGRMKITWKIIPLPTAEPISYVFKTGSSQYWAEVQVRNARYPIAKLEYRDPATGQYIELPRQLHNYFRASTGMGAGPFEFRVTDFYGHVLTDRNIALNTTETPVNGAANFPY